MFFTESIFLEWARTKSHTHIYIYIYILLILPCIGVEGDLFGAKIKKQQYI